MSVWTSSEISEISHRNRLDSDLIDMKAAESSVNRLVIAITVAINIGLPYLVPDLVPSIHFGRKKLFSTSKITTAMKKKEKRNYREIHGKTKQ